MSELVSFRNSALLKNINLINIVLSPVLIYFLINSYSFENEETKVLMDWIKKAKLKKNY